MAALLRRRAGDPAMSEADRIRVRAAALALDGGGGGAVRDKPDAKADVFADLGSPVSPLRARASVATSSSSSSGSAKSPAPSNAGALALAGGRSHSGELTAESTPPRLPGHRRCGSGPLIFSGGSSGGSGGGGGDRGSTASSPMTNALPAGNICPSGASPSRRPRRPPRSARTCSDPAPATTATGASCAAAAAWPREEQH